MAKKTATKKSVSTTRAAARKPAAAKKTRAPRPTKVDYYPNRMTVAISAFAGTVLVLLALISVYGAYRGW